MRFAASWSAGYARRWTRWVHRDAQQLAFFDERLDGLDRAAIQAAALERFDVGRMVDAYEALYARLLGT